MGRSRPATTGTRQAVWALLLAVLLTAGIVGVLLFNTAMQQQSVTLDGQQQRVTLLQNRAQSLETALHRTADPARLAQRARRLRMHPAQRVRFATGHRTAVSGH